MILHEAHDNPFALHPEGTKMYHDLWELYWWTEMKREILEFAAKCLTCQRVKAEHQVPIRFLQPISIPKWKWEHIMMDFVIGLSLSLSKKIVVWVIVDWLTKLTHFVAIRTNWSLQKLVEVYIREIFRLHDVTISIMWHPKLDRDGLTWISNVK